MRQSWRSQLGTERQRPTAPEMGTSSPLLVASIVAMVFLLLGGGIALLRGAAQDPAATLVAVRETRDDWSAREAALRQRLRVSPGDDGARVRLIAMLTAQALLAAQDSSGAWAPEPTPDAVGSLPYNERIAQALQLSPQLLEAHKLAETVAKQSPDRRLRACAWAQRARMYQLLGSPGEGMACMEAATREDPAWRETLTSLKRNGRRAGPGGE